jgi:nitroreductase
MSHDPLDHLAGVPLRARTPDGVAALRLLLTRYSVSARRLHAPGPSDDDIATMTLAALRAPDRNKMIPFRFVVARGDALARLADHFEDYGRRRGKSGDELASERTRAMQAPVVVGVVARIVHDDPEVPAHEQWACVGGAIGNALLALHFMGYAGKMVSGTRAADPAIVAAHCRDGETLVGWIAAGTPDGPPQPRGDVDPARIVSAF